MKFDLRKTIENLFYLIVFLLPWQAVWLWREPFVGGYKWEYGVIGVYGVDILMVLFLVLGIVEYIKDKNPKSETLNPKQYQNTNEQNSKQAKFGEFGFGHLDLFRIWDLDIRIYSCFLLSTSYFLLIIGSFLSIFWSPDKILALYFSLKLLLAGGFFWAIRRIDFDWKKLVFVLLLAGLLQGVLAVGQFLTQETFSSKWLGMSEYAPAQGGASVVENSSGRWLRAYGTFAHPNMLGGYLAIILLIIIWKGMINLQSENPKSQTLNPKQYQNQNDQNPKQKKFREFGLIGLDLFRIWDLDIRISKIFLFSAYCLVFSGLILSFSRSAWLIFVVGLAILFFMQKERRKELGKIAVILAGVALIWISAFSPLFFARLEGQTRLEQKSLDDRSEYVMQAKEIISKNFWLGVGAGNYTAEIVQKNPTRQIWQIQPVHNVFLLVWAELGLVGLVIFLGFMVSVFLASYKTNRALTFLLYVACCMLYVSDHWLWTSHFGLLAMFLVASILLKEESFSKN